MNALANCASVATRGTPVKDASRRKGGGLRPSCVPGMSGSLGVKVPCAT
jgi:hypothetical protein